MDSIAVFAPLIVNSFRELKENEKHIIEDITSDLKIKSIRTKIEEEEEKINEELIKLRAEREKEVEREKIKEQRELEKEREREKEREKEREQEKEKEELKNEVISGAADQSATKNSNTITGNMNNANKKVVSNNDEPSTRLKRRYTKVDMNDDKSNKKDTNDSSLKNNNQKNSIRNNTKEASNYNINEVPSESTKLNNESNDKLSLNKNFKSKIDLELTKENDGSKTEVNNPSISENNNEEDEEDEDILLNIKNLDQRIQECEESLRLLLKKKKRIGSIKKLSYNDYMFVDPLQFPKSIITVEHPSDDSNGPLENKKQKPFDLKSNDSSDSDDYENEVISNPTNNIRNDEETKNDGSESDNSVPDSSLPFLIPLTESNTSLNEIQNSDEEDTEKDKLNKVTEDNDYIEANDDCNELFLMGYPRLHDFSHKHLFQNQRYRDKQRYFKMLKEKHDHRNQNTHQKFVQTQNRTNIKLKKRYPFQKKNNEDEEKSYRNYHPLLRNFQLQQMNAKVLYQQELDKINDYSDSLNSSVNSLYREEINELFKSLVPASPSRHKQKCTLPSNESYKIENFEKDTSSKNKTKVYYNDENNRYSETEKITNNESEEEEDEEYSSSKELEKQHFSSDSSNYYRRKTAKKRRRKMRLPIEKRVHRLLNKCTSLKKINIKSPLSKLHQHIISICKNDNETDENKLLNNIECYKIMQTKKNQKLLMQIRLRQLGVGINYKQYLAYKKMKDENKKYDLQDLKVIQFKEYRNCIKKFIKEQESKVKSPQVVQNMISSKAGEIEHNSESSENGKQTTTEDEEVDDEEYLEMEKPEVRAARCQLFKKIPYQEGSGYIELFNGNKYWGEFENNLMNGIGRYEWNNGLVYEGEFENNYINGIGKYIWKNSNIYIGSIDHFIRNGYGEYINNENKKNYIGEWKNGKLNGYGILKYDPEGKSYYEGEWKDDKKNGKGKMVYASGNVYVGDWKNDLKDGFGKMEFRDRNEEYVGFWQDNLPNGKGIYTWNKDAPLNYQYPYHNQYEGDWDNGKRWGYGIFKYSSGAIYDGEWFDNMKHGLGIYVSEFGHIYEGTFKYDRTTEPFDYYSNDNQHFFDLSLIYEDEKTKNEQLRSLNTIIIRYISELNSLYEKYHNYHPKENKISKNYTLSYIQLWKLLEECEISKNSNRTIVEMNREYAKIFKDRKYLNYKFHELHNENQHLTIHDFYEYLIHVSYLLYSDIEIPSINEDGISVCFSHFIKTNILPYIKNKSTFNDTEINNLGSYIFQNIKDKYGKIIYDIYKDHSYYHKNSLKSSKGDITLNIRDIIFILEDYEILDEEILTVGMVMKIFSIYFIPGINQDGVFNFDYEILPYEFLRFLFYCILVKYCPDEHYIRLKRNKFYNEAVSQSKIDMLQKSEEDMSTPNIKNDTLPNTSNSNSANSKKIENNNNNNNNVTSTADKATGNKKGVVDTQDINNKSRSSNISAQKKKQNSNLVINETPDKSESASKNIRKTANSVNPPAVDDKNNDNNSKKDTTPATAVKDNLTESSTNESLEQSEEEIKPETTNTLKYKFFEFTDVKDPKYIISTFMSKLSISKKEEYNNDSIVKLDDNTSDIDEEDDNKKIKESKESALTIIDINKLDPEVQEWMLTDIENIFETFSTKLEYFKKRNENQRLAMLSYYNEVKEKQIEIKRMREEQINLNKKLQNEIINSKWVTENMSKFDEVTNDGNTENTTTNPTTTNTNTQTSLPQPPQAQTQVLSHQDSHQQTPPSLQNKTGSVVSLSGNKNDNKNDNRNSSNSNQDNQNTQ